MKLDLRKHVFGDIEIVNTWAELLTCVKKGDKIPCINFTRLALKDILKDREHLLPNITVTSKGTDIIDFFKLDDIMVEGVPIRDCTTKRLRKAHNIRKMYIAGAFDYYFRDEDNETDT